MGAAVAAVIMRKEKDMVEAFRSAGATARERARVPSELGVEQDGLIFRRLHEREVLREAAPGAYYLDEPVWAAVRRARRRVAVVMLLIVAALGFVVYTTAAHR